MSDAKAKLKEIVKPAYQCVMDLLPARLHVMLDYLRVYGRLPNLDNPQSFSEKIVSRKLYDHNPRMPDLVDKIRAKEIVAAKFGEKFIIPTLASYKSVDELDFAKPPLTVFPYVLKTNHGSGANFFIKSTADLKDITKIKRELAASLKRDHSTIAEEWAYSKIAPRILVEPYIEMPEGFLADYKFHVFSGHVYVIETVMDRFNNYGVSFYDRNWNRLDLGFHGRYPRYKGVLAPPAQLHSMMSFAEALGKDFSYVRVDLYQVHGDIKLGEMTFYPGAGHDRFDSAEWDRKFGAQWTVDWPLPGKT